MGLRVCKGFRGIDPNSEPPFGTATFKLPGLFKKKPPKRPIMSKVSPAQGPPCVMCGDPSILGGGGGGEGAKLSGGSIGALSYGT